MCGRLACSGALCRRMDRRAIIPIEYRCELGMESLVWTREAGFPAGDAGRLIAMPTLRIPLWVLSSRPPQLRLSAGSRSVRPWRIDPDRYPVTFLDVIRRRQIDDLKRSFPRRVVSARRRVILRNAPVISASEDPIMLLSHNSGP